MTDEPKGGPEAIPGEPTATPEPTPAPAANVESEPFVLPTKLEGKTAEQIAQIYVDLETQYGKTTNELGDVRGERDAYSARYNADYVVNPDDPKGEPILKLELESRQAAQPQQQPGQLSQDEIDDRIRTMIDEKPQDFVNLTVDMAERRIREGNSVRDAAFSTPAATKVLTEHPDIGPRAERIALEMNVPLESALHMAAGEKMMGSAPGGDATAITPPAPQVNLGGLKTPNHTFMGPHGKIPEAEPKTNLTPEQIARGKEMWNLTAKQMERYAKPKEER